jgi:hypothetical protein
VDRLTIRSAKEGPVVGSLDRVEIQGPDRGRDTQGGTAGTDDLTAIAGAAADRVAIRWYLGSVAAEGQPMDVERGCRSKQAYLTKAEAKQVVRLMGARHRDAFNLYRCEACGYYHIGHLIPAVFRAHVVPNWSRKAVEFGV